MADVCVEEELALNCCRAVQLLALPRFREAKTAPVVGDMVRVLLEAVTDETPPTQVLPMEKQPPVRLIPLAKVEVAMVERTLRRFVCIPQAKVEVAVVEVAVKYEVLTLSSNDPIPATDNFQFGEVVPMPRPVVPIRIISVETPLLAT